MSIPSSAPLTAPAAHTVDTDAVPLVDANATSSVADAVVTLDPLRFPLQGSQLIEASAGTGKTFTIATLYVRLVLGHGIQSAPRAHTPPEILVVTFTEAATQELRDRIRARLTEAAAAFRADPASIVPRPAGEDPLHDLRQDYEPDQWPGCAYRLQLAADWMDEAAVSTIHAWCHRMLREHAFDSGSLFNQTLETDQTELLAEGVRDYWRTFMVPLGMEDVAEVRRWWADPEALRLALRGLVAHAEQLDDAPEPALALGAARQEKGRCLAALKAPWATWTEELQALLDGAVASRVVDGRKLHPRFYHLWLNALRAWVADPTAESLDLATGWKRLTPAGLDDAWKPERKPAPEHPALAAIADLGAALGALPDAQEAILRHAARWVAARFAVEQARRAQMGFHDLLTRLDAALRGSNGARLADTIRRQFPVALIDEFQDTDPVQYRIFDTVYRVASNDPATALILIGDPKQAIYAFRGADIHTYLQARQACAGRLHTLGTNYRSTHAMVRAANRCFAAAEARATGAGAFLFRGEGGNPVPFIAAEARGRGDALHAAGQEVPALTTWWLPPGDNGKALNKETYRDRIAEVCASEMVRLLNLGQAGQAGFGTSAGSVAVADARADAAPIRPLRPADLAVLVNKRQEADLIRRALARRGVRSVYLSDQDSVYQSPQAGELRHWLAACAAPDDLRLVRAALATPTLGLSWAELDRLNQDDLVLEERVLQFRGYRDLWRRQGVLPMLRGLLNDFRVPARLLGTEGATEATAWLPLGATSGERVLTDLLHLAELLQRASLLLDGEHALIRYLAEQCQQAGGNGRDEARQIRLESDADLVQVVTVHKSKGLEYPLVFLPFAADFRPTTAKDLPLKWHDDRGELQLTLSDMEEAVRRADRERLGEDLRKLYVALTRARHATWVGLAPIAGLEEGAFGYLLGGGEPLPPAELAPALERLRGECADLVLVPAPAPSIARYRSAEVPGWPGRARDSRPVVTTPWWIASYSAISRTVSPGALGEFDTFATTADEAGGKGGAGREGGGVAESESPAIFSHQAGAAGTATEERFLEMRALGTSALAPEPGTDVVPDAQPGIGADAQPEIGLDTWQKFGRDAQPNAGPDAWPAGINPLGEAAGPHAGEADEEPPVPRSETPLPDSPHAFPRGPEAGSFLHDLLEWAATQGFGAIAADPARLRDTVGRRCRLRGWEAWIAPLSDWLLRILTQPLPLPSPLLSPPPSPQVASESGPDRERETYPLEDGKNPVQPGSRFTLRLADLTTAVPEMEFWLATQRVAVGTLDRLVSAATLDGTPRPALEPARLYGMLRGFMDLVFEHQGRYYVADYKSNWLGPDASAYTPAALRGAILHARYELQYVLYLLALHRLLKSRLPDYDYDRHVGGAVYLFLRGIDGPCQGVHWERPPRELIETLDALFRGAAVTRGDLRESHP